MESNIVSQWYEDKRNVDDMKHWEKGQLKKWEDAAAHAFTRHARILDIGCGLGREAFALTDLEFHVVGIDISREVIRQVTALSQANGYEIPFHWYDGKTLPFEEHTFDVVIIWSQTFGLLYGDDYKKSLLRECYRVLRSDGLLSYSGHDFDYIKANHDKLLDGRKFYPYENEKIYWETFLPQELSGYAYNAGFTVLTCQRGEIYKPEDGVILHCLCEK